MRKWAFINDAMRLAIVMGWVVTFFSFSVCAQQSSDFQTLHGHVPSAVAKLHLQPLHNFPETNQLSLAISLPLRNDSALSDLIRQIYNPASTNYHCYLTPEQFTAQFGPSQQDYDTVITFLKTNGLTFTIHSNRMLVDASGDAATINRAFHLILRVYQHPKENRTFYASDTEPVISPNVPISHITGLDNFVIPHPLAKIMSRNGNSSSVQPANGTGSATNGEYMGKDFRAAYVPGLTLNGAGQTVGLFELDAYYTADITNYERVAGLPRFIPTNVSVNGGVSRPGSGDGEVSLDIEMAISMATNLSQVIVYEAPNGRGNSVPDLLSRIASDDLAKQISSSWLIGDNSSYDTYYQQMAAQGQSFFQASGDDGAFYSGISEWADDTNITLVGGTTLNTTGPAGAWSSETVWNWYSQGIGTGVGGGGINFNNVPIPAYQLGISMTNNQGSTTLRNVPDVALTADDIFVYYNQVKFNGNEYFGGTSCAAPLWAGFTALVNQQALAQGEATVGFINPAIYAIGKSANYTSDFHDITTGNNTNTTVGNQWFATNGYDLCTGWGTPNGTNLINALAPLTNWTIAPVTGFTAAGWAGGPFTPNSQGYLISNPSQSSLKWSLINTSLWLGVSATTGTLAAGDTTNITISLNGTANTLTAGTYSATVTFTNGTSGAFQSVPFTLQVNEPLAITPGTGFAAGAAEGGPFTLTSQAFLLTNSSLSPLNWQATGFPSWLDLSSTSGTLGGGANTTVTTTLNAGAFNLTAGIYTGQVSFTDENSGIAQNRQFSLAIGQSIVLNSGFETGDFTDWTLNTNGLGTAVDNGSISGITPHLGIYFAAFGQPNTSGFISQTLPTIANQSYLLSLWLNSPDVTVLSQAQKENIVSNTPNLFVVSWNGTTIFNETNIPPISGWTNLQFVVTATGPATVLQFSEQDTPWYLGLDDVNVWPIPNPTIRGFSSISANNALSLTWNSLTNVAYEVQYSTNLASTNWFNLNTYIASGSTLTVTNVTATNPATYYRILRLP